RPDPGALVRWGAAAGIRGATGPLTTVAGGDRAAPGPLCRPAGHQRDAVGSAETSETASTGPGGDDRGETERSCGHERAGTAGEAWSRDVPPDHRRPATGGVRS